MQKSIKTQTASTMLLTLAQKALAFVRSAVCAALFGATGQTDAFYMATSILGLLEQVPNLLSTSIIPLRTKEMAEGGEQRADDYTNAIINLAIIISAVLAVVSFVLSPLLLDIFAPGFPADTRGIAILMLRILTPMMVVSTAAAVITAVLNYHKRFLSSSIGGISSNLIWLVLPLLLWRYIGIYAMLAGYMAGMMVQTFTLAFLLRRRFKYRFIWNYKNPAIKRTFTMCLPLYISMSASMVCQAVDKSLASGLSTGSVSALSYAQLLMGVLTAVIIEPVSTVIFTTISQYVQASKTDELKKLTVQAMSVMLLILLPATLYCVIFDEAIVSIVLGRGAFDSTAVYLTGTALIYYSLGFVSYGVYSIINKVYTAFLDTKTPMFTGFVYIIANIVLDIALVGYMGLGGLALATSIASSISTIILVILIRKKLGPMGFLRLAISAAKIALAAAILVGICLLFKTNVKWPMMFKAAAALVVSGSAYFLTLILTRHREVVDAVEWGLGFAKAILRR